LIDRIRHDIQERLEQLLAEAEKLRRALVALDPREKATPRPTPGPTPRSAERFTPAAASTLAPRSAARRKRTPSSRQTSSQARSAPGATKTKVLRALSLDGGMTAGDIAKATGLGHGTVSTTLSKLVKTGEVIKAERGYRLPAQSETEVPQGGSTEA
jgi:DNA-binding transcriptional ArsR family regulator